MYDKVDYERYTWSAGWGYLRFKDVGLSGDGEGMYYVHGRWYSPYLARFISVEGYLETRENGT